jgi:arsenical pump membrane protein
MMLMAEAARREGLFEVLAARAVRQARGSTARLYLLVWAIGVPVTAFLSNDATAVALTPAVLAACRAAKAPARPHLIACAMIANAASFALPISNPANLVVFGGRPPALWDWLARFGPPSAAAIVVSFAVLWLIERQALKAPCATAPPAASLTPSAKRLAVGLTLAALALSAVSAADGPLGPATFVAGLFSLALVSAPRRILAVVKGASWSVLALTAALFVIVAGLEAGGGLDLTLAHALAANGPWGAAAVTALASNLATNLPVGLLAGHALAGASTQAHDLAMIGVDLGPNLAVSGSLATLLWLAAIRRERETVSGAAFLKVGVLVMPAALAAAVAVRLLLG